MPELDGSRTGFYLALREIKFFSLIFHRYGGHRRTTKADTILKTARFNRHCSHFMLLTLRTERTGESSGLAESLSVTIAIIHRAGLSQAMEGAVLLYVDV